MSVEATCSKCETVYALSGRSVKLPFICNTCVNFEYIKEAAKPAPASVLATNDIISDYEKRAESDQKLIDDLTQQLADAKQQAIKMNHDYQSQHKIVVGLLDTEVVLNTKINKYCALATSYEAQITNLLNTVRRTEKMRDYWRGAYTAAQGRVHTWQSRYANERDAKLTWRNRARRPFANLWKYLWTDNRAGFYYGD